MKINLTNNNLITYVKDCDYDIQSNQANATLETLIDYKKDKENDEELRYADYF